MRTLRQLVWIYFWLLLFEGALRKWLLPQLSNPLLIIRDPVVIAIYLVAIREKAFPRSIFVSCVALLAVVSFAASFTGIGTFSVTLFGLRANFLHLPLMVLLPHILSEEDVKRFGWALLAVLPGMALLAMLQFKGGPTSHWNVGAGGEVGGQLYAGLGKVRASGTFSFVTGMATYLGLCTAYLLYDLLSKGIYTRGLVFTALPSLVLALAVSGSRTAVITVAFVCATVLYMGLWRPAAFGAAVRPVLLTVISAALLTWVTPLFREGLEVHKARFETGGGLKEGIVYRTAEEFQDSWDCLFRAPPLGIGLGIGTNAGARLLAGHREFLLGEGEWQRIIMESGPFIGVGYIVLRCSSFLIMLRAALEGYRLYRPLPLLLVGVTGIDLINGQFGQPTALGFAVFTGGVAIAAARFGAEKAASPEIQKVEGPEKIRGRSSYADRLHGGRDKPALR